MQQQLQVLKQPRLLLVYGVSVAFGNIWGGKLADRRGPIGALVVLGAVALTAWSGSLDWARTQSAAAALV